MREIKKTDSKIVISENHQNKVLETLIFMKFDAGCNETNPEIVEYRFHEDYEILTKMTSKSRPVTSKMLKFEKNNDRYGIRPLKR